MPLMQCTHKGQSGWKWGDGGRCYVGKDAKKKALIQGLAIGHGKIRNDAIKTEKPFVTWLKALGLTATKIQARMRRKGPRRPVPRTVERKYEAILRELVAEWRELYISIIDPHLVPMGQEAYVLKPKDSRDVKTDSWPDDLTHIMDEYDTAVSATLLPMGNITTDIGYDVADLNLKQWKRVVSSVVGINVFAREPWLSDQIKSFSKQNVKLIKKLSGETSTEIERVITDGFQRGRRIENIRKDIIGGTSLKGQVITYKKAKKGVKVSWFQTVDQRAKVVARDQTNKLNGQLTQLRQNEIDISMYIWRTVLDEKVRTNHRNMDGRLCRWDDATVYSNDGGKTWHSRSGIGGIEEHPGQDYQCRCFAEAFFASILGEAAPAQEITTDRPPAKKKRTRKKAAPKLVIPTTANTVVAINPTTPPGKRTLVNAIRKNDLETLAIVNPSTNKVTWAKTGTKNSVSFDASDLKAMKQQTVIHNHPGSSSFSGADIDVALRGRVGTMEVYSQKYTYKMRSIDKGGEYSFKNQSIHSRINSDVQSEWTNKIREGKMSIAEAESNHWHEVNKRFAQETGLFKYERIKIK